MFADRTLIPTLPASDIARAKAFYTEKLGLKPIEGEMGDLTIEAGDSRFVVYPSEYAGTNRATAASWEVEDLDACVTDLKSVGVEFQEFELQGMKMENSILTAPNGTRAAWFVDSEGNIVGLSQPA